MENEKRLIDANALKEKLQEHHDFFVDGCGGFRYLTPKDKARVDEIDNCIAEIVNATTVDAVEVVRCKDCKYAYINSFSAASGMAVCKQWSNEAKTVIAQQDDFCSYGERREGE